MVASITATSGAGNLVSSSPTIWYQINNTGSWVSAQMTPLGPPNVYRGYIPSQSAGTVVHYYLAAQTDTGVHGTDPERAALGDYLGFLVGRINLIFQDDFVTDLGWSRVRMTPLPTESGRGESPWRSSPRPDKRSFSRVMTPPGIPCAW